MDHLQFETKEQVAVLTIQSPPANALATYILKDLAQALDHIEQDSTIKAVVLKGEGKFFSAGADIKEFTSLQAESEYSNLAKQGQQLFNRIENYHVPVIAAIHGAALGGGLELAMSCHMRIVTESAKLGLPELSLGIIPGFAGTQRLPRYVGQAKAYEMILSGEPISGVEAASLGLANHAVADEELESTVMTLAGKITSKSGPSIHAVMRLLPYTFTSNFESGLSSEADEFGKVFGNDDAKEGVQAFIEKRKPQFKDQ
ncbi:enoyl-CoA hydratase [Pontibacillus yanchengensis]|uniref:Enoyl-CoA hydratase n=1 Tax=Pontibacillus yanchengensis Y32 TaxID=1385514 RepID=A0A0A2THF6_9BACI|nr:enoyl-CoA hydratase [Pontibacillus yanchengensis]KGP73843.1 enoyl-CoA hydratase [Pontibacillus yanchengensis Y32]